MHETIGEIRDGIREIAANTGKLAVLEERHAETRDGLVRAFTFIETKSDWAAHQALESRVREVEVSMPALKETRKWVVGGVLAVASTVGLAVIGLVMAAPR